MKWASAASTDADLAQAVDETTRALAEQLGEPRADLLIVFVSPHHADHYAKLVEDLRKSFDAGVVVGCSGGGVIGGGVELEEEPALALTAAQLPDVRITARHMGADDPTDDDALATLLEQDAETDAAMIVLIDPFTMAPQHVLDCLDEAFPRATTIGGVVSGGDEPGSTALFCDAALHRTGALVLALEGELLLDTIVAQGCRPIDRPRFVTRCRGNLLQEIDGKPAMTLMRSVYETLPQGDQKLFQRSLFVGVAMRDQAEQYEPGDFLVRNIIGVDPSTGSVAVGGALDELMVVQLHLRDARTSAEELERMLKSYRSGHSYLDAAGILLFQCLGRGRSLYGVPNHDSALFQRTLGNLPLGGFFCNGEIGPVRDRTFVHGYTSSFGIFRPRAGSGGSSPS